MNEKLYCLLAIVLMFFTVGCAGSNEIKEPSREGFNAGELSPATSDAPQQSSETFDLEK